MVSQTKKKCGAMLLTVAGKHTALFFIVLLAAVLLIFSGCSPAKSGENDDTLQECSITSAKIDKRKSKIKIDISITDEYAASNKGRNLYLFEILPHQSSASLGGLEPVATQKTDKSISEDISLYVGTRSRLYSSFILAEKSASGEYNPITKPKYIENPEILAASSYDYPVQSSKKGLIYDNISDSQAMGISHTVITVDMSELLRSSGGQGTTPYVFSGVTYYLDKEKLAALDYDIKVCTDAGVNIFLNIVLGAPKTDADASLLSLYYDAKYKNAKYYAINLGSEGAVGYFEGFIEFISDRYTRENREFGFAGSYIIGYEINSNRNTNYMGEMPLDSYLDSYIKLLRIADTAVRSNYKNGMVYVSVGNNFTSTVKNTSQTPNPQLDYPAKDLLSLLNENISKICNIPWNIAVNPYASDRSDSAIWSDTLAENNLNTPFITMQNINVFTDFMSAQEFLYNGEVRSVIISEFGVSADPTSNSALEQQAASYAYAYYSAQANDKIDAFIYSRQIDKKENDSLYTGLWTLSPRTQKPISKIFKDIDTAPADEVSSFALRIIGATGWSSVIPGFTEQKPARSLSTDGPVLAESKHYKKPNETLFDFTGGELFGFYPSDNAAYVELRSDENYPSVMYAMLSDTGSYGRMGISRSYTEPLDLKNVKCITLKVKVDAPESVDNADFTLLLKSEGDTDRLYEGKAQVSCGKWVELTFYIRDFLKKSGGEIDLLKLLVSGDGSGAQYGLWVESISVYRGSSALWIILIIIVILLISVVLYFWYTLNRANNTLKVKKARIGSPAQPVNKPRQIGSAAPHAKSPHAKSPMQNQKQRNAHIKPQQKKKNNRKNMFSSDDD